MFYNFGRDVVDVWARTRPDNTALYVIDADGRPTRYSYADISRISSRTAARLNHWGIGPGDRILVVLGKHPAFWPIMVALLKLGAVPLPGTTQLTQADLEFRIQAANARGAIVLAPISDRLAGSRAQAQLAYRITVDGDRPDWQSIDPFELDGDASYSGHPTRDTDLALIYFTSGTTGHPKMVAHNHRYPAAHAITATYWLGLTPDDLHWNLSDTGWAKAAWSSLFAPWIAGAGIVVDPLVGKFNAREMLDILSHHPVTSLCAPPTVYRMLVQEDLGAIPLPYLRSVTGAGEPLNPEVISAFRAMTGLTIRDGYGQTETVLLIGTPRDGEVKPGSMGKPAPPFTIAIIDERGEPVPDGQEGDIALFVGEERPPGLFDGYVGDPEGTQSRFVGPWYTTGDRAMRDEDGYFWFVARADDVIISAGYRIGPFEVESALISHPAVVEAAAVAAPDPIRGQVVKAYVVLGAGYQPSAELADELKEHVRHTTAPYKYPRIIEFVTDLPKTISGKIRRIALRELDPGSNRA